MPSQPRSDTLGPLQDGGRVVIIGGGPGGVGCALALHHLARQIGRQISITLFEGKEFAGGKHHNLCVGIVSPPLPSLIEDELGVPCPDHLRQGTVTGYVLHTAGAQILLDDITHPSFALRRVQFDDYMLEAARWRGIQVVPARVTDLEFHADGVSVFSEASAVEADVVVGAFGLDSGAANLFSSSVGYQPPAALVSVLTRFFPVETGLASFGPYIHAFLPRDPSIEFAAISPKGDHLNVNIAGTEVNAARMRQFLTSPLVQAVVPELSSATAAGRLGIFKGRFPCSLAKHYHGDRYVIVGDAAGLVRAFKGKGVTSAVQTGIRAANTILLAGIGATAFGSYFADANRDITDDLIYGQAVRLLVRLASRFGLLDPIVRAAGHDREVAAALYGAVSGHEPYREVLARMFRPSSIAAVLAALRTSAS